MVLTKNKSIYRRMLGYQHNDLYLGKIKKNIKTYTKEIDKIVFKWLFNISNDIVNFKILEKGSKNELILKKTIMRCAREIIYNIIRRFNNFIDATTFQAIAIVSYGIAYKFMSGYDFDNFPGFNMLAELTAFTYTSKYLKLLEIDILVKNDWNPCKKVYNRLRKAELAYSTESKEIN